MKSPKLTNAYEQIAQIESLLASKQYDAIAKYASIACNDDLWFRNDVVVNYFTKSMVPISIDTINHNVSIDFNSPIVAEFAEALLVDRDFASGIHHMNHKADYIRVQYQSVSDRTATMINNMYDADCEYHIFDDFTTFQHILTSLGYTKLNNSSDRQFWITKSGLWLQLVNDDGFYSVSSVSEAMLQNIFTIYNLLRFCDISHILDSDILDYGYDCKKFLTVLHNLCKLFERAMVLAQIVKIWQQYKDRGIYEIVAQFILANIGRIDSYSIDRMKKATLDGAQLHHEATCNYIPTRINGVFFHIGYHCFVVQSGNKLRCGLLAENDFNNIIDDLR